MSVQLKYVNSIPTFPSINLLDKVFKKLNNVSLKTQVITISALSLIGIAAVAFGANYTSVQVSKTTNFSIVATDKASLFSQMDKLGLEMRRREKEYLVQFDESSISKYEAASNRIVEISDELLQKLTIATNRDILFEINAGFEAHAQQFNKVVSLSQEIGVDAKSGYIGDLNKLAQNTDVVLEQVGKTLAIPGQLKSVTIQILILRLHQNSFMLSGDPESLALYEENVEILNTAIKGVHLKPKVKKTLIAAIRDYENAFRIWSSARDNYNNEVKKLGSIYAGFVPLIVKMINAYERESEVATNQRLVTQTSSKVLLITISFVIGIFIAVISFLIATNIALNISQLSTRMKSLAEGDTASEIPNTDLENELGDMASSLFVFKKNTVERIKAEDEKKHLNEEEFRKTQFVSELIEKFQTSSMNSIGNVRNASERLEGVSRNLNESATQMQGQSHQVIKNVEDTSENVTNAATATGEMVSSISEIAQQAALSTDIAEDARVKTSEAVEVIDILSSSAKHIEQVVNLIEEIAEQTNLLALNANIEAARAGDAGKGFAVVANEVKGLANQTATATDEIAERVAAIQADSLKANKAIVEVENIIGKLSDSSLGVASAVEEQSAVINEIASNVTNASTLSSKSAESINVVGASIDDTKVVSNDVYGLANDLNSQISGLENDISKFLMGVKSV